MNRQGASILHIRPRPGRVGALLLLGTFLVLSACQGAGGRLELSSLGNPGIKLATHFDCGFYAYEDINHATVVLLVGKPENPEQALIIRPIWTPSAGDTPIAATASNAQFTYVIFAGSAGTEAGIYTGYGFLYPNEDLGDATFSGDIWDSTMELADKSPAFTDPLGKAVLKGNFSAERNDLLARQLVRTLSVAVSRRLPYARVVDGLGVRSTAMSNR